MNRFEEQTLPKDEVQNTAELEAECEYITRDHLQGGLPYRLEYHGLETDAYSLMSKLLELQERDYVVSHVRKHCVTGVKVVEGVGRVYTDENKQFVVGIGLRKIYPNETGRGKVRTSYLDYVVDTAISDDNAIAITKEIIERALGKFSWVCQPAGFFHGSRAKEL